MGFHEDIALDGKRMITFLFRLSKGISSGSYGIECARLAGVPEALLEVAGRKAEEMQMVVQSRSHITRYRVQTLSIGISKWIN